MCGIAGIVDFADGRPPRLVLKRMVAALRHRGPDADGVLLDGPCGLGHARLSIIDIAQSHQPMRSRDERISLTYNGELYNYPHLREQLLSAGAGFVTRGDTEVLLQLLERDWAAALPKLNGMFGFAAWDSREQRLLLARDPIGEKPVFYTSPRPGVLVFASEIKALFEHPEVERGLNADMLRQVLRFRAGYGTETLYDGILQLPPGHYMLFSRAGIRIVRYHDLAGRVRRAREQAQSLRDGDLVEAGYRMLRGAVKTRLLADVPVGAFLSGGLDSSLIVALMRAIRSPEEEVRTFSVGFRDDRHSELPFAAMVAEQMVTRHHEVEVDEQDYSSMLPALTRYRDAPVSEPADVAIAKMSRAARQHVKVVLSGEGADEVFGGYPKYRFASVPAPLRWLARSVGPEKLATAAGLCGIDRRRALVAARALSLPDELGRLTQWFSYLGRSDLIELLPGLGWEELEWDRTVSSQREALHLAGDETAVGRMQVVDCLTWLPGNLLERGDRMTMATGLELRLPFLDVDLVAFGLALPDRLKVSGRSLKRIVRIWAREHLPRTVVKRRKWGFRVPLADWFRGRLRPMLFDYLLCSNGICGTFGDRTRVEALLSNHDAGRCDANLTLWSLLTAEVWYQDVYRERAREAGGNFSGAGDLRLSSHLNVGPAT